MLVAVAGKVEVKTHAVAALINTGAQTVNAGNNVSAFTFHLSKIVVAQEPVTAKTQIQSRFIEVAVASAFAKAH